MKIRLGWLHVYGNRCGWFRLFGYGISWKNNKVYGLTFSQRNGYVKYIKICDFIFTWIKK